MIERVTTMLVADSTLPVGHPDRERTETVVREHPVLVVDRTYITADSTDMALVTYDDPSPAPPASVTFDVNGSPVAVDVDANGVAELEVTSSYAGQIRVSIAGVGGVTITAEAP